MQDQVLALDIGSTTAKAQPFDRTGRALAPPVRGRVALRGDGTADPLAFCASVEAVVDQALRRPTGRMAAVAVSCAWHGLVGLDGGGRPTTPLSTWQHATAGAAAAELLRRLGDPDAVARRTGAPVHPSFPPARLLWWAEHDPAAFAATVRWCSTGELLESRWFASPPGPSSSMASASGLFDQEAGTWDAEVLGALGLTPAVFAPVDDAPRAGLSPAFAARWPALASVPWFPALGDGACAALGTGCDSVGRAALTVGTSAAVRVLAAPPARAGRPLGLFCYLLDPARIVLGGARSNAGNLVEWCRSVLRVDDAADFDSFVTAVTASPPGSHGLAADPALAGERSPDWPLLASGAVSGLRHSTTARDVAQALLESAATGLARAVDLLEDHAGPLQIVASGRAVGGSPAWRRLLADVTGRPIVVSRVDEASARGAALYALEALGWRSPAMAETADGDVVRPDSERAAAFARLRR